MSDAPDVLARVGALLAEIEAWPSDGRKVAARRIVQAILELHGEALGRMLAIVRERGGADVVSAIADDPLVSAVLLVHDAHPVSREERVAEALAALDLAAYGARATERWEGDELVVVLERSGRATRSGPARELVERAIGAAAPDVAWRVDASALDASLVPAERLVAARREEHA